MQFLKALSGLIAVLCPVVVMAQQNISIQVLNSSGTPVANATIAVKTTNKYTVTDSEGRSSVIIDRLPDTLVVSHVSYVVQQYPVNSHVNNTIVIVLSDAANVLDETVVIGYGSTSKRMNTGSVGKLGSVEIRKQPVSDVVTAMTGRVAGVLVTQTSGVAGSTVKLQVRGRNSITQGSEPLYIIDGVPMAAQNAPISKIGSILDEGSGTGLSSMGALSPSDVESIEVLKDADATAIYGSRGANGVVLITTKKGKAGKTRVNLNVYRSTSGLTRTIEMMGTEEYIRMRNEAFANDGVTANTTNAPDLKLWDASRYTNMQAMVYTNNAPTVQADMSITGGDLYTQFIMGGSYRKEQTMFEGGMGLKRVTGMVAVQHRSRDNKVELSGSVNLGSARNRLTVKDLGYVIQLVPNLPQLYDADGRLRWQEGGVSFNNPFAYLSNSYDAQTAQLNGRVMLAYTPFDGFKLSTAVGYNNVRSDETAKNPLAAQNPNNSPLASLELSTSEYRGWLAEPQAEYRRKMFAGRLHVLAGATLQDNVSRGMYVRATGYTSDNLINSLAAAPTIASKSNTMTPYRYQGVFGRVNYNWKDKYILNISGRRDGSSRFGKGKQFSAFGAAGAAWLFGNERWINGLLPELSYGKVRCSYGSSGNDQIGDYGYMDAWTSGNAYQGVSTLYPMNLYNADYRWEVNRKLEAAIELGFFMDKLLVNVAWYRNRSSNQLVGYRLPSQTGFNSVLSNLDAVVENTGIEAEITSTNVETRRFMWKTSFNVSVPRNKLVSFPNLASSSYAFTYVEGQSLNVIYQYKYSGVDATTGVFAFEDRNKDGTLTTADYVVSGNRDPKFFGGLQNSFLIGGFELDVFAEFRKQTGINYLYSLYGAGNVPGGMFNLPVLARDRWQQAGDIAPLQRLTAVTTSAAYKAANNFLYSDGVYSDASFIRIRNVSLRYNIPSKLINRAGLQKASIYVQGQNVVTFTNYKGSDPEVQNLWMQSPLKTWAVGVSVGL
jgi:TonB-linked SusC/RagA family outer membrane protein